MLKPSKLFKTLTCGLLDNYCPCFRKDFIKTLLPFCCFLEGMIYSVLSYFILQEKTMQSYCFCVLKCNCFFVIIWHSSWLKAQQKILQYLNNKISILRNVFYSKLLRIKMGYNLLFKGKSLHLSIYKKHYPIYIILHKIS